MDVALTSAILQTATAAAQRETADAVQVTVLRKAMDINAAAAVQLIEALPAPQLAASGTLGTQVNTYA